MPMQVRFLNTQRLQVRVVALPGNVIDVFGRTGHVVATLGDYTASQITNVPAGSVTAVTVQAAIDQLATGAGVVGTALTKTDDTNVTATLGGTPLTALLRATSIALGWTGTLAVSRGGIGTSTLTSHGVLIGAGTGTIVPLAEAGSGTVLTGVASSNPAFTATLQLGVAGSVLGQLVLAGNTSGTITINGQAAAGTFNFNLPTSAGTSGQPLLSGGGGAAAQTYGTLGVPAGGTGSTTWNANGVVFGGTNSTATFQSLAAGTSSFVLTSNGVSSLPSWQAAAAGTFPYGILYGLRTSNNGGTPTTDLDVAAGSAADSTNAVVMTLAASITKKLSAVWAVGTNQGGLDTGTKAVSTWYYVFLIRRPDTGVVDVLFSLSATAPTMPTNYTQFRRIGSIRNSAANAILAFNQQGDEFLLSTTIGDINGASQGITSALYTLTVPPIAGIRVLSNIAASAPSTVPTTVLFSSPDQTDQAANGTTGNATVFTAAAGATGGNGSNFTAIAPLRTVSGQVRCVSTIAATLIYMAVYGWTDERGRT